MSTDALQLLPPLVEPGPELTPAQVERYARNALLPQMGALGQRRLLNARALIVGAGALGSPALLYLAAAGIGHLGVVDSGRVELPDLSRQVIHGVDTVGSARVDSARNAITRLAPEAQVTTYNGRLTRENAAEVLDGWDLVVDCADIPATHRLVADSCEVLGTPSVWGCVRGFEGRLGTFWPGGPGYRDVFPEPSPREQSSPDAEAGPLGPVCAAIGSAMTMEVIRLVTGIGRPLVGRVVLHDALAGTWTDSAVRRDPDRAPVSEAAVGETPGAPAQHPDPRIGEHTITASDLSVLMAERDRGEMDFTLVDVREPREHELVDIASSVPVPRGEVLDDVTRVPAERPAVLFCRDGTRSAECLVALLADGREDVWQLSGGILAWIEAIEPGKPRY